VYLLDTDILIFALKGHSRVRTNLEAHVEEPMALSVISLLELNYGAHKSRYRDSNLVKVRALEEAFEVFPVAPEISQAFGSLKASLEEKGTPL
jgi:predicted nucleic acid-binding protein